MPRISKTKTTTTPQGFIGIAVAAGIVLLGLGLLSYWFLVIRPQPKTPAVAAESEPTSEVVTTTTEDGRAVVKDNQGKPLATFTNGARTVVLSGPSRTFSEPGSTKATITTTDWVRIYPKAFNGDIDKAWLNQAVAQNNRQDPDLLAIAMQYTAGATALKDAEGQIIAGDANFGPGQADGDRQEGSDYNDFLGIAVTYGDKTDKPEAGQIGSLDCSGFQRMIWGYRSGLPLELDPTGTAIPRRAYQILASAPGVTLAADNGKVLGSVPANLQTGDILFFNVEADDGARVDHMGVFLGVDSDGNHRFISSRKVANGPTFGDIAGKSIVDGNGFFAKAFRAVRRF